MADDIDSLENREQDLKDKKIAAICATPIAAGKPGDCDFCGEYFTRLVNGACGGCRDKYKLD